MIHPTPHSAHSQPIALSGPTPNPASCRASPTLSTQRPVGGAHEGGHVHRNQASVASPEASAHVVPLTFPYFSVFEAAAVMAGDVFRSFKPLFLTGIRYGHANTGQKAHTVCA